MSGKGLNGYAVPYAVVASLVGLGGLLALNNCTRLNAVEVATAQELQWRRSHEDIAAIRIKQLESIAADVSMIKSQVLIMSIRQEQFLLEANRQKQ